MTATVAARPPHRGVSPVLVITVAIGLLAAGLGLRSLWIRFDRSPGRDGHTRVLFVGDSMMIGASRQLNSRFVQAGAETRFIGYPGTGLLSGQGWWNREITHAVDTWHPDVVVIEACCNYKTAEPGYQLSDGTTIETDSAEMYATWEAQAKDAVRRAGAHGAHVYWVTAPAASKTLWPKYVPRIERFNGIIDDLGVDRIDWRKILTPDGEFLAQIPYKGRTLIIRDDDGLHLTDYGNALVVEETFRVLAPRLGLG